ncbi:MAG: lytic polysaccharide monooxygenase auxiliary activity family 9 protein [Pseudomonadota bacterium]
MNPLLSNLVRLFLASLFGCLFLITSKPALSHGTILVPESRIYKCRFSGNPENHADPACRAAIDLGGTQPIYDWTAILQSNADSQHEDVVPDGELCGGGNAAFVGMNLTRTDWQTTSISPDSNGEFEFIYYATAPHATKDMIMYITRPQWQPGDTLRWDDLEEFCRFGNVPLEQDADNKDIYRMRCDLPERTGTHIIYNVWQRSDSPEAFYSCSDVEFKGLNPAPPVQEICMPVLDRSNNLSMICF